MAIELRAYQNEGVRFLQEKRHALLLDSPGLGKTIQAIMAATRPVLILCPTYLLGVWKSEINRAFPQDTVAVCEGSRSERQAALDANMMWTIGNIEMARTYEFPRKYTTFIIDESHHVKGHSAQQSKKVRTLARTIPYVYLLTATPIKTEVDDLFMQLSILDQHTFSSYHAFVGDFCKTMNNGFAVKVVGARNPELLKIVLHRYALRRTYESTGVQLPPSITQNIDINPSPTWHSIYKKLKAEYRLMNVTFSTAPEMMRTLRRLTLDLKTVAAKELYADNPNTVFYTYYRESCQELAKLLDIPAIDGSLPPHQRAEIAKAGGSVVATISSLSEGVDLSHLSTVCFVETSYVPGDLVQAIARVQRWNESNRPVRIFNLAVTKTIDTTIQKVLSRRGADEASILKEELDDD